MAELSKAIARLMEERSQAPAPTSQPRQFFERLRDRVAPGERAAAESFARLLLARATPELSARTSDELLAALCVSAFRFIAPLGEEPRVRVFDPDFERDGWDAPVTVVETLISDRPFVVDTVREALHQAGCVARVLLHPILGSERDAQGALAAVTQPERSLRQESFLHAQVDRLPDAAARAALEDELRQRLRDLLLATNDYQAMRQAAAVLASELRSGRGSRPSEPPAEEIAAFLDWLAHGNFVFLGYRTYLLSGDGPEATIGVQPGSGLGLLRKERSTFAAEPRLRQLDPALRRRILSGPPLVITKTTSESPVHRRGRMDYVGVRQYDGAGRVSGEKRFVGLLTSRAYAEESAVVPLLRRKLERILEIAGAADGSHDGREIVGLFNSFPKEHLLAGTAEEIHRDIQVIRTAPFDDVRVTVRLDQLERGLFVMVAFPRESYSADLRRRIEAMVARTSAGTVLDQHVAMEEGEHVRLHFYVVAPAEAVKRLRAESLQADVRELLRTWDDRLRDALETDTSLVQPRALARQYAAMLSPEYKAATDVGRAVDDIGNIEALVSSGQTQVDLHNPDASPHTTLKVYLLNEEVVLSDFLPVLENLGLRVFAQNPIDVHLSSGGVVHIHAFEVQSATAGARLDLDRVGSRLADAILAHRAGRLVDDELGSLVLSADLTWQQVHVLRAYANHTVQCGLASRASVYAALAQHPASARALWDYLVARFDPAGKRLPRERLAGPLVELEQRFLETLEAVAGARDDAILRAVLATAAASTRTNAFHRRDDEPVAFKLAPENLAHLPRPRPRFEIFVFGAQMEGVHLRAGKIARGGIRSSDRPDDYRTEILDLMKTQVVKNAVIVPTGAKGGFCVRRRGAGVAAGIAAGDLVAAYRAFIGALLSLTDNIVQGRVVAPPGVLYDEPDPYLVVAADKGTAALSDVANEVAAQRGFWLGDAFASGGSHGYDHKALGITARGAWECVRRHFRELERDADRESLGVIGIGDMSGDVFGNGLLLSRELRLYAAFNHRHIFLDPEPDPAVSYAERARLFAASASSWDDYQREAISPGGGVYARTAKKIPLSAEARARLGVEAESLSGEELVRAILRAETDLLWNGGIGTYVKARAESHADAADAANDAVRVDGADLRAGVVAEGGNLGFTQLGRIEYAVAGGRIDTDAIDNAGGVCLSDREVNLKILFGPLLEVGEMTEGERDRILGELTAEVVGQVLETNRRQARALTLDQVRSQSRLPEFLELIRNLEQEAELDRALERLPDKDSLRRRRSVYLGLTRPELAVLLAHAKMHLQHRLLASTLPDDPQVERSLHGYFPRPLAERHRHAVRNHRLRREIIAVEMADSLIDLVGVTFVPRVAAEVGCEDVDVVRAWTAASTLMDLDKILDAAAAEPLPVAAEQHLLLFLESALDRACTWLLRAPDAGAPIGETVHRYLAPAFELTSLLPDILHPHGQQRYAATLAELGSAAIGDALARRLANAGYLADLLEVAHIAAATETPLRLAADVFHGSASILDLDWVSDSLAAVAGGDRWEKRAVDGLLDTLVDVRREITRAALSHHGGRGPVDQGTYCLSQYAGSHEEQIAAVRALINDVKSAARPSLAALVVIMREIGELGGGE